MARLSDVAEQVAPISDPDTDIPDEPSAGYGNVFKEAADE